MEKTKGKTTSRIRFSRQKPIENFIADFYCYALRLIIEVDGSSHNEKMEYDEMRSERIRNLGFQVIRFTNNDVLNNIDGVIASLEMFIDSKSPLKEGI